MPNFTEVTTGFPAVPQIETTDLVLGGSATSPTNLPLKALVERTAQNKSRIDSIVASSTSLIVGVDVQAFDSDLTAVANLTGTGLIRRTGNGTAALVSHWVDPFIAGGRLSLAAGESTHVADVIDANRVYYTPHNGAALALYTGTEWRLQPFIESSASISTLPANTNYDVFVYLVGNTLTLDLQPWTNDTTRSVAIVRQDGVWCKSGDLPRRYVGSFRTTGAGKTESSATKRFLYNAANQVEHILRRQPGVSSWPAVGTAWRAANGDNNNRVQVLCGLRSNVVDLTATGIGSNNAQLGISINTVGTATFDFGMGLSDGAQTTMIGSFYKEIPRLGLSFYQLVERSQGGTSIFNGSEMAIHGMWRC
jgi:hypothetical protein